MAFTSVPRQLPGQRTAKTRARIAFGLLTAGFLTGPIALIQGSSNSGSANVAPELKWASWANGCATQFVTGQPVTCVVADDITFPLSNGAASSGLPDDPFARPVATVDPKTVPSAAFGAQPVWVKGARYALSTVNFEDHEFVVAKQGKSAFRLRVVVGENADGFPYLARDMSIQPDPTVTAGPALHWQNALGLTPVPVSDPVKEQVNAWAKAYFSDDRRSLYALVGETAPDREYPGIKGMRITAPPTVISVVTNADGSVAIAEVVVTVSTTDSGFQAKVGYDLGLSSLQSAQPKIFGWGPAGTGTSLSPGSNAVLIEATPGVEAPPSTKAK